MRTLITILPGWRRFRTGLCVVSMLAFSGCGGLLPDRHSLVGAVELKSASSCDFKAVLTTITRDLEFEGLGGSAQNGQRVKISVVNHGDSAVETGQYSGPFVLVDPNTNAIIYDGEIPTLTNTLRLPVMFIEGRTHCDFHLEFSSPPQFTGTIRMLLFKSYPSL
jgi:hypothetical protein